MTTFQQIIDKAPTIIKAKLQDLMTFKENPKWHPEDNAFEHTRIVTERCLRMFPNDANMFMTGILHDICKFDCAVIHMTTGQPTSYGHEAAAVKLIETNKDVQNFIRSFGATAKDVKELVANHMRMHSFTNMKPTKQMEMMTSPNFTKQVIFATFDNMLIDDEVALAIGNSLFIQNQLNEFKRFNKYA